MAEEKRSIEISYKANLKDLVSKLKTLPNVTGQEAKKMVAQLDRQIKQAEKAAKKATEAQKKAAKSSELAFKRNAGAIKRVGDAADKTADHLRGVGDEAGEVDRMFSAVGLALRQVNPALGEAADSAADAAAVSEGLTMSLANLNPVVIGISLAVGAAAAAYALFANNSKKALEELEKFKKANEAQNDENKNTKSRLDAAAAAFEKYKIKLKETTGEISEFEAAQNKAIAEVKADFKDQITDQENYNKQLEKRKALLNKVFSGSKLITEEEKETLKTLQFSNSNIDNQIDLLKNTPKSWAAITHLISNINEELAQNERALKGIQKAEKESIANNLQALEFQQEMTKESERQENTEKEKGKTLESYLRAQQKQLEIERAIIDQNRAQESALNRILDLQNDGYQKEKELIANITDQLSSKAKTDFELHKDKTIYMQDWHAIEKSHIQKLEELDRQYTATRIKNNIEVANSIIGTFDTGLAAYQDYLTNSGKMSEENAQALFKLQQMSGLASIAISTAEGLHKAASLGPVAGVIMGLAVAGSAAAQTAAVLSEQPPTLHMGGLAPDERSTILNGEAVLDRTTTRNLGPEGIRQLQNNPTSENVIVIQPFKHFDRFNKSARKRRGRKIGSGGY